ncbi:MAG: Rpn family recombination-promoting nuclease/putative transposase, partial [Planctomycetaceae bacterium]|nr:Rpn family recombination-promoting nuclease/putative transposase [Planctomycetaceae bacterium]
MLGKNDLVIKPTSDLFSAVLWSAPKNEPILRSAINAVLKNCGAVPITKATVLNPFNISNFVADKRLILDVRVQDEMKRFYDIEMQTTRHTAFVERMLYSWASVYASQLRSGDEYSEINPVYSIIFSEKSLFRRKRCHLVFEMRERNEYELLMSPFIQMHYLLLAELIKGNWSVLDGVHPELQHWLIFLAFGDKKKEKDMANLVEDDTKVMAAYEEFHRFTADPVMREKILDWDRALVDDYFFGKRAGIRKGFAKGLAKGIEKGLAKGLAKGLE